MLSNQWFSKVRGRPECMGCDGISRSEASKVRDDVSSYLDLAVYFNRSGDTGTNDTSTSKAY